MRFTVRDFVEASLYPNEDAVMQEALQLLLQAHPEMKIELAIVRYQQELLSIEDTASLAGVSWGQMKNILVERGIPLRFKTETFVQKERPSRSSR
ncbi:hypothetical protein U27_03884 [Candidatus Vecturithrix granuli]|uniref:Uncharacterized protein n=1 Tax=Vecturithrix granuli TaxID=1499967 RepID=A0A081BX65_VECG1|nr:hypothetical protein U27_03884 [Candidatus Vecturithrix granuli]